jgi:3-hydroxyisobutyrate dehydrogenase-like beta-hydroxyacid dehydrogenase
LTGGELTRITVFGLGEAGSLISADLVEAGTEVWAYDPADVTTPEGVNRFDDPLDAVVDADVVLGLTAQADAHEAINQAIHKINKSSLYADLSTSSAAVKRQLSDIANSHGIEFVDVALMTLVPGNGLRTPALASGLASERFVSIFKPLGMPVESISQVPGDAATRKLLRSVMMKGLASLVIEAMRAGYAAGCEKWLWKNIAEQLDAADEKMLSRLVTGTGVHALRRLHEMEASLSLLQDLEVDPVMTRATVESHKQVQKLGVPEIPEK